MAALFILGYFLRINARAAICLRNFKSSVWLADSGVASVLRLVFLMNGDVLASAAAALLLVASPTFRFWRLLRSLICKLSHR
jgi:hypothetical protein